VEIRNYTGKLERGEAFLRAKAALADTDSLSIHSRADSVCGRDVNGYYRWEDRRMVLAVKQRLRYPRAAAYGVGTTPCSPRRLGGGLPYRLVWHEERFESGDDLLVFVAGHEFWHFLCHSGQRKRDHETKANCNGFAWLREFRTWTGTECPVAEIPMVPPRPDQTAASSTPLPAIAATIAPAAPTLFPMGTMAAPRAPSRPTTVVSRSRAILDAARQLLLFR